MLSIGKKRIGTLRHTDVFPWGRICATMRIQVLWVNHCTHSLVIPYLLN